MSAVTGRTILITGGARGLGAGMCAAAARAGYRVGVFDLERSHSQELVRSLQGSGHVALEGSVTDEAQVAAAFDEFGVVPDVVVNNAGIVRFGPLHEQSVADFRAAIDVNLTGTYIVAREAARRMLPRHSGVIINLTSINALSPGPGSGAYPASKAGVARLTEQFALELGPEGIRVNCVAPGFIDGGMSTPIYADQRVRELRGGAVPLRGLGRIEDIANAVLWLASDEARYVSGHQLVVDGAVSRSVLMQLPRKVD